MKTFMIVLALAAAGSCSATFEPTALSLNQHQTPEWFQDAKFGIYTHWTPATIGSETVPNGCG